MKMYTLLFLLVAFFAFAMIGGCRPSPSPTTTPLTPTLLPLKPSPTPIPLTPTLLPPKPSPTPSGKTIVVTSIADSSPGTLRQAMFDARPYDVITFDPSVFPPDAPATIALSSGLPELNQGNLTIDASNAGVILDGSDITTPEFQHGISISSDNNIVRGLQIIGFSDAGIGLYGGAQYNIIGGDRSVGDGIFGQGNLISGNGNFGIGLWDEGTSHNTIQGNYIGINIDGTSTWGHARDGIHSNGATENLITGNVIGGNESSGVYLCCVLDGRNTVTGNMIGVGPSGTPLGNRLAGVLIDRTRHNVVGPGNIIAFNHGEGVLFWENTPNNTVTQNSIRDNSGRGIGVPSTSQSTLQPPLILNFDLQAGTVAGAACVNCTVEIFSDGGDEAAIYEGQTEAEANGAFTFVKGAPLAGPFLSATATDSDGSTTEFSLPIRGTRRNLSLQDGNALPIFRLQTRPSVELADNRIGISYAGNGLWDDLANLDRILDQGTSFGTKRVDTSLNELEPPIAWSGTEFEIPPEFDRFIDALAENGVAVNYMLHFWDKVGHASGQELSTPRFKTPEQVQDFLDYARFIVGHFEGRIQYYTIWSEPDNCISPPIKCVEATDYINLARQTIPVIRQEDPQAKVVLAPNGLFFSREYLFTILTSDVIPMFDVISWHGIYDVAPNAPFFGNYYYEYPSIIQEIKQTASGHGFQGEYWGTEITWCSEEFPWCHPADQPWGQQKTDLLAAKYYARGIVMHLGMDVGTGVGGFQTAAPWSYPTMRNLNTVMAGTRPTSLTVKIEGEASNIMSYGFILPNGDKLFALWTNGAAVEDDPGINTTIIFPDLFAERAVGIDVLNGFEQELIAETENGNLVIRNLLVRDYPIILLLIH